MRTSLFVSVILMFIVGCGAGAPMAMKPVPMAKDGAARAPEAAAGAGNEQVVAKAMPPQEPGDVKKPEKKAEEVRERKIRYTANLQVVVADLDKAWEKLKTAMKETKAVAAQEEINTSPGTPRAGTWKVRVPVAQLDRFREAVVKLGDVSRNTLQSEDLTAQYYDLAAHLDNRNAEREAIRDLLKEIGKKDIKHYLEIKRELDAITDDINRKEGQLRLWKDLTDLTTVTVQLQEKIKHDAPKPPDRHEVVSFGTRAETTWQQSIDALVTVAQGAALVAIALAPWVALPLAVLALLLIVAWRRAKATKVAAVESQVKKG